MNKHIYTLLITLVLFGNCYSQDSVQLHITYLPTHVYNQNVSQKTQTVVSYRGSDSILTVLKQKGIQNPEKKNVGSIIKSTITTGIFDGKNKMPVELEFSNAEDLDGNSIIPSGTRLIGSALNSQIPVFDSIISDNMDEEFKDTFLKTFKNFLSQFELPNKKMALGDMYTQITPFNMPIGSINFKMNIETIYKLVNLNDSLANFDIAMKFTMDMNADNSNASGSGEGNGTMVYDRVNQFPVKNETSLNMDLKMDKNPISIEVVLQSTSINETIISKR